MSEELNFRASTDAGAPQIPGEYHIRLEEANGLFVLQSHEVQSFLLPLPVGRIPGAGQVTESRMRTVGIATVGNLHALELSTP
jgi:DNA polymerase IV